MDFLSEVCNTSATLRLFYVIKLAFYTLKILLPLLCIFTLMKRLFNAVISKDTQKDLKDFIPASFKTLAAAAAFFFVPVIVEYAVNELANQDIDFAYCFTEAELDNIKELEKEELNAVNKEAEDRKEELNKVTKEKEEIAKAKYAKKASEDSKNNTSVTQTSTGGNTTRVNEDAVLANGTSNKYFAPLQKVKYSFGTINNTGGCSNKVYHDLPVKSGSPLYAGMNGTVKYYQYVCGDTLYGYGNLAVLVGENGTYINYAHLSEFPSGINEAYTKSCPKAVDGSEPCPSNFCNTTLTKIDLGSKEVKKGQVIGYTGDTGNSTGPHLHVEIHENGSRVCVTDPFRAFGMR